MPQFITPLARQQAQLLMQPALIRVIDNIRKQLDVSSWQGTYEDQLVWPEAVTEAQKQQYLQLLQGLDQVTPEVHDQLQAQLAQIPHPQHIYTLCLTQQAQSCQIDIWQLCYRICCTNYDPAQLEGVLEVDTTLFDPEIGEIDWARLDDKARRLVAEVFEGLGE